MFLVQHTISESSDTLSNLTLHHTRYFFSEINMSEKFAYMVAKVSDFKLDINI